MVHAPYDLLVDVHGSCLGNHQLDMNKRSAGFGVFFNSYAPYVDYNTSSASTKELAGNITNQRVQLLAAIWGIRRGKQMMEENRQRWKRLAVLTSCEYVIKGFHKQIKLHVNLDLWEILREEAKGVNLRMFKVDGDTSDAAKWQHKQAAQLARSAARRHQQQRAANSDPIAA